MFCSAATRWRSGRAYVLGRDGISGVCPSISRATRCRSFPNRQRRAVAAQGWHARDGRRRRCAERRPSLAKGAVLEVAGAQFQLIPHAVRAMRRTSSDQRLFDVVSRRHVVRVRRDRVAVHHDDSRHRSRREEGQAGAAVGNPEARFRGDDGTGQSRATCPTPSMRHSGACEDSTRRRLAILSQMTDRREAMTSQEGADARHEGRSRKAARRRRKHARRK